MKKEKYIYGENTACSPIKLISQNYQKNLGIKTVICTIVFYHISRDLDAVYLHISWHGYMALSNISLWFAITAT